ncbi:MAG: CoA pyrophosphatase [Pseudomonadales bacterium]|nr:CoA pyrophosphatase [Pseudomonadales bacterium]
MLEFGDLPADVGMIRRYFAANPDPSEIRNPHPEKKVSEAVRSRARPAAVLIPIVDYPDGPALLVTRRHQNIRFAGHICFPGGSCDEGDESPVATALRESAEEINLDPSGVEVLGVLGNYYTQTGYRITPVVGVITPPLSVRANPAEVDEIMEVPLAHAFSPARYKVAWHNPERGHIAFTDDDVRIAGPTVSLLIGLCERLDAG